MQFAVQTRDRDAGSATAVYVGVITALSPGFYGLSRVFRTAATGSPPAVADNCGLLLDTPGSVDIPDAPAPQVAQFFGLYKGGQGDTQGVMLTDPQSSAVYFSGDIQVATANSAVHSSNWIGRIFQLDT